MPRYRGRFAPSPSGALHFGSLVAALASYLEARNHDGSWLVRIEDVDPPRVVAGAGDRILRSLEAHGFEWDGPVLHQSGRRDAYRAALADLRRLDLVYPCTCSRKDILARAGRGVDGPVYPGTCRAAGSVHGPVAWRYRTPPGPIRFEDRQQGLVQCDVAAECGDFVLRRADDVFTYQLAVVVDDAEQGISDVVRGADLLTSTPRQIALQQSLALPTPGYLHLPVALDAQGGKLSKQTLAAPIDDARPTLGLLAAAAFLAIPLPRGLLHRDEFWPAALAAWSRRALPPIRGRRPKPL